MSEFTGLDLLSQLVFYRTYAKTKPNGFRETPNECVDRGMQMHIEKFPKYTDEIVKAFDLVRRGVVVPSMRFFQFSGDPIKQQNSRIYNCSYNPITSFKSFADLLFLSMCGCGVGFSVQKQHIRNLPRIATGDCTQYVVIQDSKEGWADSMIALLENPQVEFVYGQIRRSGSILSSGGTASGAGPLREAHEKVRKILKEAAGRQLKPIEVHDIICHIADAVVVGGVRRSALISLFDADDNDMLSCKSGSWWEKNGQRARANNSAVIYRDDPYGLDKFYSIFFKMLASNAGEPGIIWSNHPDWGYNPCQPEFATVLTPEGIKQFKDIDVGSTIWTGKEWTKVTKKWSTGIKEVFRYKTSFGEFVGTENHRVFQDGERVEAKDAETIDIVNGPDLSKNYPPLHAQDIMDGLVIGGGSVHRASNNLVGLCIDKDDREHFESGIGHLIIRERPTVQAYFHEIKTTISADELPKTYERRIPERFMYGSPSKVAGFLCGLFSANGSVVGNGRRVTLKGTSEDVIRGAQKMLSSLGIRSYITINEPKDIEWANGIYTSRKSYDLNITSDRFKFRDIIGFKQQYKNEKIVGEISNNQRNTSPVVEIESLGEMEVFDITVEHDDHCYWTGGLKVSNCCEISLKSFCNLTEINVPACNSSQEFFEAAKAATFIGKLQSTYTDFNYIAPHWKKNAEEEMLLGVSLTGQAENWPLLSAMNLRYAAQQMLDIDEEWSKKFGVGLSHRIGTTKPSGTTSAFLGTTSGIHAAHAEYYIRRVRVDMSDPIAAKLTAMFGLGEAESNSVVELDKMSPSNIVVSIPVAKKGAITRDSEGAVALMNRAAHIHENWIVPSHREGPNTHNVSLTVNYKEDEVGSIMNWMVENRESYAGISLLPFDGGTYPQLPFQSVTEKEYLSFVDKFKGIEVDFSNINFYGTVDTRQGELACAGGNCEIT